MKSQFFTNVKDILIIIILLIFLVWMLGMGLQQCERKLVEHYKARPHTREAPRKIKPGPTYQEQPRIPRNRGYDPAQKQDVTLPEIRDMITYPKETECYLIYDYVKLREEPDTTSTIIAILNQGDRVWFLHKKEGKDIFMYIYGNRHLGNWVYVTTKDRREGWVFSSYLTNYYRKLP